MIFKVFQCSGVKQFGFYLMKIEENEYVEVYEVSGFMFDDFMGVMKEVYVLLFGIKCK